MSLARRLQPVSFEEYLASQRDEGQRFDFWDGALIELEQCVFIAQHQLAVESFERASNGQWLMTPLAAAADELIIPRLDHRISLEQIYHRITF